MFAANLYYKPHGDATGNHAISHAAQQGILLAPLPLVAAALSLHRFFQDESVIHFHLLSDEGFPQDVFRRPSHDASIRIERPCTWALHQNHDDTWCDQTLLILPHRAHHVPQTTMLLALLGHEMHDIKTHYQTHLLEQLRQGPPPHRLQLLFIDRSLQSYPLLEADTYIVLSPNWSRWQIELHVQDVQGRTHQRKVEIPYVSDADVALLEIAHQCALLQELSEGFQHVALRIFFQGDRSARQEVARLFLGHHYDLPERETASLLKIATVLATLVVLTVHQLPVEHWIPSVIDKPLYPFLPLEVALHACHRTHTNIDSIHTMLAEQYGIARLQSAPFPNRTVWDYDDPGIGTPTYYSFPHLERVVRNAIEAIRSLCTLPHIPIE